LDYDDTKGFAVLRITGAETAEALLRSIRDNAGLAGLAMDECVVGLHQPYLWHYRCECCLLGGNPQTAPRRRRVRRRSGGQRRHAPHSTSAASSTRAAAGQRKRRQKILLLSCALLLRKLFIAHNLQSASSLRYAMPSLLNAGASANALLLLGVHIGSSARVATRRCRV
jgi:hypothetical protein